MVRDEIDIIQDWLDYHVPRFDKIAIYDSSTDGTWEALATRCQTDKKFLLWHDLLPHKNKRRNLLLALLDHYDFGGWVFQLDADNFLEANPRELTEQAEEEGAKAINARVAQFYFTDLDYQDRKTKLFERRQYYLINWNIILAWKLSPEIHWHGDYAECPTRDGPFLKVSPVLRHYQWRNPEQAQKKLNLHFGKPGFSHLYSPDWRDYVFDHRKLHHVSEGWVSGGPRLGQMRIFEAYGSSKVIGRRVTDLQVTDP